jgi:hypothetical protein
MSGPITRNSLDWTPITSLGGCGRKAHRDGSVRIWTRRLRDSIGLMLGLASSDLETVFQRTISNEMWSQIREAVRVIAGYGAWKNDKVAPLLGGNESLADFLTRKGRRSAALNWL